MDLTDARWLINFVLPIGLTFYGLMYRFRAYRKMSYFFGYRTSLTQLSKETWEYANKRVGNLWMKAGLIYTVITILYVFLFQNTSERPSIILFALGFALIMYTFVTIEKEIKAKFDDKGEPLD